MIRRTALLAAVVALGVIPLSACAAQPLDSLPDGVTVSIYQTRLDVAARTLEVTIANGTPEPLTITSVTFESDQFTAPSEWTKRDSTRIAGGATADLALQLSPPNCDTTDPTHSVTIGFTLSDGRRGITTVAADDRIDRLPLIEAEDCIGMAVAAHAALGVVNPPRIETVGGQLVARVDLSVAPTGASGSLTIVAARGTVILAVADPATGVPLDSYPLDVAVDGSSAASTITITLVPTRCDPHAVAEDKRGTILPFDVSTSEGRSGTLHLVSSNAVRKGLYDFVAQACGGSRPADQRLRTDPWCGGTAHERSRYEGQFDRRMSFITRMARARD